MKRIEVFFTAQAIVTERWVFDVPDDFDGPGDEHDGDWVDWLDRDETATLIDCTDEDVDHEHDREFVSWAPLATEPA